MIFSTFALASVLLTPISAVPLAAKPLFFLLAGDSTTHSGSGWGDGFLSTTLNKPSSGINYGHSGATTKSFRAGGDWGRVVGNITSHKSDFDVWVTIQFGHNDQKANSGVTVDQFKTNLKNFADEAKSAGATPVLVTPLSRRNFDSSGKVKLDLIDQVNATLEVAKANNINFIDLNKASMAYVNAIGKQASTKYDLAEGDSTHLNDWGSVVFGRIVSDLLVAKFPEVAAVTKKNETLSQEIAKGVPA